MCYQDTKPGGGGHGKSLQNQIHTENENKFRTELLGHYQFKGSIWKNFKHHFKLVL